MDKRLWYKMLGKEDAFDRSLYYNINENPIKLKRLLKKEIVTPLDRKMDIHTDGKYLLRRKTTGEYYAGGNIHTPTVTKNKEEAASLSGNEIKDIKYNWPMSWDLIDLSREPDKDNMGGIRVNEIMIPKDIEAEIKKSISMGFDRIVTGMISPKRKGIMLVNKKNQVRGTYDLKLKGAVQQMIDAKNEGINEFHFTGQIINTLSNDLIDFMSKENKKLGYVNPLDTYHLIQHILDSGRIISKVKGIK